MSKKSIYTEYYKELYSINQQGDAREESFYPALASMLKTVADATGRKHVHVTTLPKSTDAGNPDFRLWNGTDRIVGYVEAKKPTEERLDLIEESEQIIRYRNTFPNLILTNFFEFRLYRYGERVQTVLAARPFVLSKLHTVPVIEKPDDLQTLLDHFLDFALPKTFTAESLAVELAKRTRFLRDVINQQLAQERESTTVLSGFYEAFKTYLIGTLTEEDFADLFAQTITYGLFASRTRAKNGFSRRAAFDNIPHTIGLLRDLFRFISLGDLPEQLEWCVDDIAEVLAVADAPGILDRYYHEGKGSDPIVHFYETFLAQYDPAERERRGVYYTPLPVVNYIVRSLHGILKNDFGKTDGLASEGVTLLDPAAGTMTFIAYAAQQAVAEFETKYGKGGRVDFIRRHILKNFYAFELMMAPYAMGHLKMSFFLEELGHRLDDDERVPFYLTNTLDNEELQQSPLPGFSTLAEESRLAGSVKMQTPILVILGNPPYSGISSNKGEWITDLVEDYKYVDGKHFGEKKHWLQDDYVKFLRFAQWKIDQAGRGVVGMITNHGYLDNPTFRGMRQSLMRTFDEIYILDLHGNSLKKETCPDGSPDKNVFDIRQGVAIAFFVKRGGKTKGDAEVRHYERYGLREAKYDWLNAHNWANTDWQELHPNTPFYFFVHRNEDAGGQYRAYTPIDDIFPVNLTGIVTARDELCIDFKERVLLTKVRPLLDRNNSDDYIRTYLASLLGRSPERVENYAWRIAAARASLQKVDNIATLVTPLLYRPFDIRKIFYHPAIVWRCRQEVMHHMLAGDNLAMLLPKRVEQAGTWQHAFALNTISDHVAVSLKTVDYHFPLYLYPTTGHDDLFAHYETSDRKPNINAVIITELTTNYGKTPTPEAIFYYIYAVLYAPAYRTKYAEFLKMDFPCIPFTADANLFRKLSAMGEKLVALHLLKSPDLDPPACRFEGEGDECVGKDRKNGLRYDAAKQRVYINATQHFAPVPEAVWAYQVGGYQVCEKWLKDRKEHRLELDDIRTYCWIVTAIGLTLELQQQIDVIYPEIEIDTIPMSQKLQKPKNETQ
jgi:hypothetical protein